MKKFNAIKTSVAIVVAPPWYWEVVMAKISGVVRNGIKCSLLVFAIVAVPGMSLSQTVLDGQLPNDGGDHLGKLITITDAVPVFAAHCGITWHDYACVLSDRDGGASLIRTCSLPESLAVAIGDQFDINTQTICNGQYDLTLTVTLPTVGNVENDGQDYVGRIVVITDPRPTTVTVCGDTINEYRAVIINPAGGPAMVTSIAINQGEDIKVGDRFDVIAQTACNGQLDLEMTPK